MNLVEERAPRQVFRIKILIASHIKRTTGNVLKNLGVSQFGGPTIGG